MTYCPHCGYNVTPDEPISLGAFDLLPEETYLRGERLPLTKAEAGVLHTLASAHGRTIRTEVIGARVSDSEDPRNIAAVLVLRIRRKLGNDCPIQTAHGMGYRWRAA